VDVSGERAEPGRRETGAIEVLLDTFDIMQRVILEEKGRADKVGIYCKPTLKGLKTFEFFKFDEAMAGMAEDLDLFDQELRRARLIS
jgi:hypothetical protein